MKEGYKKGDDFLNHEFTHVSKPVSIQCRMYVARALVEALHIYTELASKRVDFCFVGPSISPSQPTPALSLGSVKIFAKINPFHAFDAVKIYDYRSNCLAFSL